MSKAPSEFGFPYDAYSIQNDFMKTLYNVFTESKIGIFESPTGTGKSLSLICGSLKWLNDNDESTANAQKPESFKASNEEPDWVNAYQGNQFEHRRELSKQERKRAIKKRIELIKRQEQNQSIIQLSSANEDRSRWKRARKDTTVCSSGSKDQDDEFLLDEYVSDDEDREKLGRSTSTPAGSNSSFSKEVQDLLSRFETHKNIGYSDDEDDGDDDVEEDDFDEVKIYYTSRTHSQLSQFVHEVNKTLYANDIWAVPLGSRKNLCINKSVNKLGNVNRMNEACLDLQKKKKDQCPHLPAMKEKGRWRDFKDRALASIPTQLLVYTTSQLNVFEQAKPRDIEDIVKVGESLSICPYYGSRQAAKPARLVVLPYQHLLHANTRESLGISLKGNIVIVDEAHNLMETINSIHTVTLTLCQNQYALRQFLMYIQRYKSRLSGKNVSYIRQIIQIVKAFIGILTPQENKKKDLILGVNEFLHLLGIDHFNMFKIERYLKESNLARKLLGFIEKAQQDQEKEQQELVLKNPHAQNIHLSSKPQSLLTIPTLTQIQAFLMTLTNPDKDGRVFISFGNDTPEPQFKYMLLNPAESFRPIVEECKSVVLAGGTMEPISDFMKHLFPYVPDSRITTFSCGHIIPPKNLLTMCIDEGPTRKPFLFNYENRQDTGLIDEVGKSIVNLCNVIPDGVVCFFASFTYLETVYSRWNSAESGNILERLAKKKKIFKEPRESGMVESTLRDYSMHIDSKKEASNTGAILLCVVNGKMSEGINFSDRLGRGVIMVGLPFPNRGSVELNEKIKYIDEHGESGTAAGREYYENLCMRGVNQSIGRAIRHRGDFSTIVLLDKRYSTSRIQKKLPSWIGTDIEHCDRFGKSIGKTAGFFRQHKEI
ncbi:helicase C-terminal domain-containing protein [Phycomyces nitens]|nr:helicase C-terminal domain-containing protein [Phycomyces nitens]